MLKCPIYIPVSKNTGAGGGSGIHRLSRKCFRVVSTFAQTSRRAVKVDCNSETVAWKTEGSRAAQLTTPLLHRVKTGRKKKGASGLEVYGENVMCAADNVRCQFFKGRHLQSCVNIDRGKQEMRGQDRRGGGSGMRLNAEERGRTRVASMGARARTHTH